MDEKEILEALGITDDDEGDDNAPSGDDDDAPDSGAETPAIKQIRNWGKGLQKELRQAKKGLKELDDLRQFKTQVEGQLRERSAASEFAKLGISEGMVKVFLKVHEGEITTDAVRQFLVDTGLIAKDDESGALSGGTTEEKSEGIEPVSGRGQPLGGTRILSAEDAAKLRKSDPVAYAQAVKAGKIEVDESYVPGPGGGTAPGW